MATTKKPPLSRSSRNLVIVGVTVIVAAGLALAYHASHHGTKAATVSSNSAYGSTSASHSSPAVHGASSGQQYAATNGNTSSSSSSSGQLAAPTGQILNLHSISLAANPAMESVCQTAPNATCDIRLINGSITKSVGAKNTGSGGEVIFDWTAQAVGLSAGQWTVQAVASYNGATAASASDALTVNP